MMQLGALPVRVCGLRGIIGVSSVSNILCIRFQAGDPEPQIGDRLTPSFSSAHNALVTCNFT